MTQAPEDRMVDALTGIIDSKPISETSREHVVRPQGWANQVVFLAEATAQVVKAAREAEEKLTEDIRILELPGGDFHQYYQGLHGSTCGGCRMLRELRARRDALRESLSLLDQEPSESG